MCEMIKLASFENSQQLPLHLCDTLGMFWERRCHSTCCRTTGSASTGSFRRTV